MKLLLATLALTTALAAPAMADGYKSITSTQLSQVADKMPKDGGLKNPQNIQQTLSGNTATTDSGSQNTGTRRSDNQATQHAQSNLHNMVDRVRPNGLTHEQIDDISKAIRQGVEDINIHIHLHGVTATMGNAAGIIQKPQPRWFNDTKPCGGLHKYDNGKADQIQPMPKAEKYSEKKMRITKPGKPIKPTPISAPLFPKPVKPSVDEKPRKPIDDCWNKPYPHGLPK